MKEELKKEITKELDRIKEIEQATYLFEDDNNIYVIKIREYAQKRKAEQAARLLKEVLLNEEEIHSLLSKEKSIR